MMRPGRVGFGAGVFFLTAVMMTGLARPAGSYLGEIPAFSGSISVLISVVTALGMAVLATKYFTDRPTRTAAGRTDTADTEAALETLKQRYATGEIDQIEFERKLELLFETETVADAEHRVETQSVSNDGQGPGESTSEREDPSPGKAERPSKRRRPRSRRGHCK